MGKGGVREREGEKEFFSKLNVEWCHCQGKWKEDSKEKLIAETK